MKTNNSVAYRKEPCGLGTPYTICRRLQGETLYSVNHPGMPADDLLVLRGQGGCPK